MDVIPLTSLPLFPSTPLGRELDIRLQRLAAMGAFRMPVIAGYKGAHAKTINKRLARLADPLVAYVPEHLRRPLFKQRSVIEAGIADALPPVSRAVLANGNAWRDCLLTIAAGVHGAGTGLRTTEITTEPGYNGNVIAYPPAALVGPLLHLAAREVAQHPSASLCETAAYAMLACTTVHPFTNGNGRTSRILFNLILRGQYPGLPYLNIKEITQFSAGDFLIATNRVHFQKDWEPFLQWLLAIVDIHIALAKPA
jgi:hypothetical protein